MMGSVLNRIGEPESCMDEWAARGMRASLSYKWGNRKQKMQEALMLEEVGKLMLNSRQKEGGKMAIAQRARGDASSKREKERRETRGGGARGGFASIADPGDARASLVCE